MKIKVILPEVVTAGQIDSRPWHGERYVSKIDLLIVHLECSGHSENDLVDLRILRLPLAATTERVDVVLDLRSQEFAIRNLELPV